MSRLTRRSERAEPSDVAQRRLALLADQLSARRPSLPTDQRPRDEEPGPPADPTPSPPGSDRAPPGRHRAPSLSPGRRAGAAVADLVPGPAHRPGTERGVGVQHVAVVALVLAALVSTGVWWVLAGRPGTPHAIAPPATVTAGASDGTPTPVPGAPGTAAATGVDAGGGSGDGTVVVDVAGKVRSPGLVTLPEGSRVADALEEAGGPRPGVDLTTLNLARPLVDGEQLLVGLAPAVWPPPEVGTPTPGSVPGEPGAVPLVDLNTATLEQLDTLPGIGPVTGQAILDWRAANGSFTSVDELLEVDGIGDATLADLRDLVTV